MKTPMDSSTRIVALNFLSTLLSGLQYRVSNKAALKQCSRQEDSQDEEDLIKDLLEVLDDTGKIIQLAVKCVVRYILLVACTMYSNLWSH